MHIAGQYYGQFSGTWSRVHRLGRHGGVPTVLPHVLGCTGMAWLPLALALLAGCGSPSGQEPAQDGTAAGPAATSSAAAPNTAAALPGTQPDGHSEGPPKVLIATSLGKITVELDAEHAPLTVRNFLGYANAKHYDQTIFHFVQPGEMILGGGFTADLKEKPTSPAIRNEAHNGLKNRRGTIAMARAPESIDSATCQFFINLADNPKLDFQDRTAAGYGYCVFGRVVAGADVVERIAATPTGDQEDFVAIPVTPVVIESVRLVP